MNTFSAHIYTADQDGAGTDGWVYIGLCGREFAARSVDEDFERGSNRDYIFGEGGNVQSSRINNPRSPRIRAEDVDKFPVYIRWEPSGSNPGWLLEKVYLKVEGTLVYSADFGTKGLCLQQESGKIAYLKKVS
jgi:hypothetical protein